MFFLEEFSIDKEEFFYYWGVGDVFFYRFRVSGEGRIDFGFFEGCRKIYFLLWRLRDVFLV